MNYTVIMRLITILITGASLLLLAKGNKRKIKAPVLLWLAHILIYQIVAIFLCPQPINCAHTETAFLLNGWSTGIRWQAILTVMIGVYYFRKVGGSATGLLGNILSDESETNALLDDFVASVQSGGGLFGGD